MKNDDFELYESEEISKATQIGRRDFLKLTGGGLFILFQRGIF